MLVAMLDLPCASECGANALPSGAFAERRPRWLVRAGVALLAVALGASCAHLGPQTIAVDRFDYSSAVAESWKQQTLLNIVKLRYMDLPVFVDVASIVSGYSMETSVSGAGMLSSSKAVQGDNVTVGGSARFTDRPTITFIPLTGERYLRGLLTPIDPKNIFSMLQSGYAADFVLGLTVESLNGVRNRSAGAGGVRDADPEFVQALALLREVQLAGAVGLRVEENKETGQAAVLFFRRDDIAPEIAAKANEVRRLLKLPEDQTRFTLIYSPVRGGPGQLAVNSRSMLQVMGAFATYVELTDPELIRGSVPVSSDINGYAPVRIHSGKEKPAQTFAAVRYRNHWFWIDDGDWQTKRAMTAIMFFFTLTDSGGNEKVPLVTIPAQ